MAKRKAAVGKKASVKRRGGALGDDVLAAVPEPTSRWGKLLLIGLLIAVALIGWAVYLLWTRRAGAGASADATASAAAAVALPVVHSGFIRAGGDGVTNAPTLAINPTRDPVYPLRGVPQGIQQMGVLVSVVPDGSPDQPQVLPLLGRPLPTHRDRWEYYTSTDQYHMMRLPVAVDGKDCQEDVGCREIYNGDTIQVPTYKKDFVAQIYKYDKPQYNPTGPSTVTIAI